MLGWLHRLKRRRRQSIPTVSLYRVEALPLPVCKRLRHRRCRKVKGLAFLGRCQAKREWCFGYQLHWGCDANRCPVAFTLRPARRHQRSALTSLLIQLPPAASVVGEGA